MVRIGLIGAGGISEAHLPAYRSRQGATLAGVCDVDEERAERVAGEFGVEHWAAFERFVEEADVDAVDITLPHHLHHPAAKAALEAGRHVLIEKPFATSLAECLDLVETAAERDLVLMVGQMQRYHPPHRALKARVDDGELGTIRHARFDTLANQSDMFPPSHWLFDGEKAGGGGVLGYAVHKIDLLRYVLGDVRRAAAWTRTVDPRFRGAEDHCVGLLEFETGTVADFFCSISATAMPYNEMFWLFGDDGMVHTLPTGEQAEGYVGTPPLRMSRDDGSGSRKSFDAFSPETDLPAEDAFVNEIAHFVDCIEADREPLSSGRDNLGTIATIEAIYRSAELDGAPVTVEDVLTRARGGA